MGRAPLGSQASPETEALLRLLREERESRGVSQRQLSKLLGWPHPRVWQIEAGTRRVDAVEFFLMVRAFGGSPAALMAAMEAEMGPEAE